MLIDPFALCSTKYTVSFIAVPVCPNYPFNRGRGLYSAEIEKKAKKMGKTHELGVRGDAPAPL